jgi:type IV pilus assembly protein PilB
MKQLKQSFIIEHYCLVVDENDSHLSVLIEEEHYDPFLIDDIELDLGKTVQIKKVNRDQFFAEVYNIVKLEEDDFELNNSNQDLFELADIGLKQDSVFIDDSNVIDLLNTWLSNAIYQKASDLHFEVFEHHAQLRFRLDGKLHKIEEIPIHKYPAVISRIKIMSHLDIGEKRRPQDGRFKVSNGKRDVDIRVSVLPTEFGEKIVLRLLDKTALKLDIHDLGFSKQQLELFKHAISRPYGMILVTGPTGSGKTTTLYAALSNLNTEEQNILTVEDPIEYNLDNINQCHVKADIGFTFASALRSFLRQDPNIIMLGEIRDKETADIAVRASLTGHLLLSTLHTNDSPSTIARLLDMGIEPYLLASSLKLVMAQRLVRRICENCKIELKKDDNILAEMKRIEMDEKIKIYYGKGCKKCFQTGYKGRKAILEIMPITEKITSAITQEKSLNEIRKISEKEGMEALMDSAISAVKDGITTLDEVLREILV